MGEGGKTAFQIKALNLTLVHNMCVTVDSGIKKARMCQTNVLTVLLSYIAHFLLPSRNCTVLLLPPCTHFDFGLCTCYLFNNAVWVKWRMSEICKCDGLHYWVGLLHLSLSLLWKRHASGKAFCSIIYFTLWSQVQKSLESSDNVTKATAEPCCTSNTDEK